MELEVFLNSNREKREHVKFAASESFKKDGKAVLWEIRALSGGEEENIRQMCINYNEKGRSFDNNKYLCKIAAMSTVYPDLFSVELQESYGVYGEEELLKEMLSAGEYVRYIKKVQEVNGFIKGISELKDEAKK